MAGMSGWEFLLIVVIGLVVLGPERLNKVANQLGGWIGQARRMTRQMKRQLEDELNVDEHFNPRTPSIAPPVGPATPTPADPAFDGDVEADAVAEAEAYIPSDDDTYSAAHDGQDEADNEDKEKPEQKT